MQLWFSRGSEISIRDQLRTQVILGILSGELEPGQRLPSTRELARRFHLHPNTVSAGYRQLQQGKWVEFHKGSGVYVRRQDTARRPAALELDQLITDFFRTARKTGIPLAQVHGRLRHWLEMQPPDHYLLMEKDDALARIIAEEIRQVVNLPVTACAYDNVSGDKILVGAIPVALAMSAPAVRESLPADAELLILQLRSAGNSLAAYLPARSGSLIGVASGWPTFLKTARTLLIAAGFDPDCLVLRDTSLASWQRGLKQCAAVISDTLTGQQLDGSCRVITFSLLADSSLKELRDYQRFIQDPLCP
jgi:DNA-binding transcriptional regulator YhcF (GntR family)